MLRALNLLLLGNGEPRQIVLCTFTEKAAFEMRDRLAAVARKVGFGGDLSELRVSTIHSLCSGLLQQHRHSTALGRRAAAHARGVRSRALVETQVNNEQR